MGDVSCVISRVRLVVGRWRLIALSVGVSIIPISSRDVKNAHKIVGLVINKEIVSRVLKGSI